MFKIKVMNKPKSINPNKPKAFLGALVGGVIGAGANILGSAMSSKAQKKAYAQQQAQLDAQTRLEEAQSMTQAYAQGAEGNRSFYERFKPSYEAGGGIDIKPENKGKFTAAAKRRGMGVQEFASKVKANKENYSPTLVKRATFAKNAAKWKKEYGGNIYKSGGGIDIKPENRGKFTASANRAGMSVQGFAGKVLANKENYSSTLVERANFARNAAKWKHAAGGEVKIENGGQAKPLSGNSFLLRGNKHNQGGIDIKVGNKVIEAEGGEVMKVENDKVKILSAQPIAGNESPANIAKRNPAKVDEAFAKQERYKANKGLNDDGTKKTKGRVGKVRAQFGTSTTLPKTLTSPVNNLGSDSSPLYGAVGSGSAKSSFGWQDIGASAVSAVGSLASGLIGLHAINRTPSPRRPSLVSPAKLKTTYNIAPQEAAIERQTAQQAEAIRQNTASSQTALARRQTLGTSATGQLNQLAGQKENIENQMINQSLLNQQQVGAQNISELNRWQERRGAFEGERIAARANAYNQMIRGVSDAVSDIQTRQDKLAAERKNLAIIAAGDVNNNMGRMIEMGALDPKNRTDREAMQNIYNTSTNEQMRRLIASKLGITYTKR